MWYQWVILGSVIVVLLFGLSMVITTSRLWHHHVHVPRRGSRQKICGHCATAMIQGRWDDEAR